MFDPAAKRLRQARAARVDQVLRPVRPQDPGDRHRRRAVEHRFKLELRSRRELVTALKRKRRAHSPVRTKAPLIRRRPRAPVDGPRVGTLWTPPRSARAPRRPARRRPITPLLLPGNEIDTDGDRQAGRRTVDPPDRRGGHRPRHQHRHRMKLGGGLIITPPALGTRGVATSINPQIVLGTTPDASALLRAHQRRAHQGRRYRHRQASTSISSTGTVTINGLDVTVSGAPLRF